MARQNTSSAAPAPHSWDVEHWPPGVFPHSSTKARWLLRCHRSELLNAGAIVRVGRVLVVLGDRYTRWLALQASNVATYESNANRSRACGAE